MKAYFKKQIALPQDHGSWVFISSPLLVGIFAGKSFSAATFYLVLAAFAVFVLRQPATVAVKTLSGRRSRSDLPAACAWVVIYGAIALSALGGLSLSGFGYEAYLAVPGVLVFAWHLWLVSRRSERRQAGIEILATGVLALSAPAVYWVGVKQYDPTGWWLWLFTWLQAAASIVYAYLRLEQREIPPEQAATMPRSAWQRLGTRAFLYTSFNVLFALSLALFKLVPTYIFVPFLVQWLETVWGIHQPSVGWKPTKIGLRQLFISLTWTVLFILLWN